MTKKRNKADGETELAWESSQPHNKGALLSPAGAALGYIRGDKPTSITRATSCTNSPDGLSWHITATTMLNKEA